MAMMISWVMPVNPSHPYLENDPAPSFAPTICAFHLGFSLGFYDRCKLGSRLTRFFRRRPPCWGEAGASDIGTSW